MAYGDWTLGTVKRAFDLEEVNAAGIFADAEPVDPSAHLTTTLERNVPLAFAMGTEKAKSELIVSAVLVELWEHFDRNISFFSGIDFNVDAENGLTGVCDFVVSLSPSQFHLESPAIVLVEAKRDNLTIRARTVCCGDGRRPTLQCRRRKRCPVRLWCPYIRYRLGVP